MDEDNRNEMVDISRQVDYDPQVKYKEKETFGADGGYSIGKTIEGSASIIGRTQRAECASSRRSLLTVIHASSPSIAARIDDDTLAADPTEATQARYSEKIVQHSGGGVDRITRYEETTEEVVPLIDDKGPNRRRHVSRKTNWPLSAPTME